MSSADAAAPATSSEYGRGVNDAALVIRKRIGVLRSMQKKNWNPDRRRLITALITAAANIDKLKGKPP